MRMIGHFKKFVDYWLLGGWRVWREVQKYEQERVMRQLDKFAVGYMRTGSFDLAFAFFRARRESVTRMKSSSEPWVGNLVDARLFYEAVCAYFYQEYQESFHLFCRVVREDSDCIRARQWLRWLLATCESARVRTAPADLCLEKDSGIVDWCDFRNAPVFDIEVECVCFAHEGEFEKARTLVQKLERAYPDYGKRKCESHVVESIRNEQRVVMRKEHVASMGKRWIEQATDLN